MLEPKIAHLGAQRGTIRLMGRGTHPDRVIGSWELIISKRVY